MLRRESAQLSERSEPCRFFGLWLGHRSTTSRRDAYLAETSTSLCAAAKVRCEGRKNSTTEGIRRGNIPQAQSRRVARLRALSPLLRAAALNLTPHGINTSFCSSVPVFSPVFLFLSRKIRVFKGGTRNAEREVGRPAKCVDSFEDGFGEITPLKKVISIKIFLCKLAKGANSAEFHWNKHPHYHRIPLLGAEVKPDDASYNRLQ